MRIRCRVGTVALIAGTLGATRAGDRAVLEFFFFFFLPLSLWQLCQMKFEYGGGTDTLMWRSHPASVPLSPQVQVQSYSLSSFPSSSFVLRSFLWIYIFSSGGQGPLHTLSWILQDLLYLKVYF